MFDKEFYPSSPEAIEILTSGMDIYNKIILEPQAGKGDVVDYLQENGAKEVLAVEFNDDLRAIVGQKCKVIGKDFFDIKPEQISHIDVIVMNPPFSTAVKHALHAWEIAPDGCEISVICNYQTIENDWTKERKRLLTLIEAHGEPVERHYEVFTTAERSTPVEIASFKLTKPAGESTEFDGFFLDGDEEEELSEGLRAYNEVRATVQRYIGSIKSYDEVKKATEIMDMYTKPIGFGSGFKFTLSYNNTVTTREDFIKELQKASWKHIINKMKITKFVTSSVMEDINKFVETQQKYPFTEKNIYKMIEIIIGTRANTMNRSLVEVFDKLTEHYHENRYDVEGWKTNSHYLVNKKFIIDWITEEDGKNEMICKYDTGCTRQLNDLQKALAFLMGSNEEVQDLYQWGYNREKGSHESGERRKFNTWYDWGFLTVKGFKKGTMHCKFKDDKVWEMFNRKVAEIKGFPLPEAI